MASKAYTCSHKNQHKADKIMVCTRCDSEYVRPSCWPKAQKFCGAECSYGHISEMYSNENSPNWKHGTTSNGYQRKQVNGVRNLVHRIVMEESLGRKLSSHENIHHINGDRADNRIENLELWSTSQPKGQRVEDKIEWAIALLEEYDIIKGDTL